MNDQRERVPGADLKIDVAKGEIILTCSPPLDELVMTPAFARQLAADLMQAQARAEGQIAARINKAHLMGTSAFPIDHY